MFARGSTGWFLLPWVFIVPLVMVLYHNDWALRFWFIYLLLAFFIFLFIMFLVFFRDPEREIGRGIISAADGVVSRIVRDRKNSRVEVHVFMNVHNVHVNRAPFRGKVRKVVHKPGGHMPAFDKDAIQNERHYIDLETSLGDVRVILIAGTLARRTFSWVKAGETVKKGQRIGMIRFSSRVDVIMDASRVNVKVKPGDKVLAGTTTIAEVR